LKWDVCITPRKQTSVSYAADADVIVCYGGAKLTDNTSPPRSIAFDGEIIEWLERRERPRRGKTASNYLHSILTFQNEEVTNVFKNNFYCVCWSTYIP
jgi:hypothetical protein